jgi:biopolymer transport protein TolQ
MFVNNNIIFLTSNPFLEAFSQSDFLGKSIFAALFILSITSWIIFIQKIWLTLRARKNSSRFYTLFQLQRSNPLGVECDMQTVQKQPNPFFDLYSLLKKHTLDILNKNRRFGSSSAPKPDNSSYLSPSDIEYVDAYLMSAIAQQTKRLEKNLFILSTVVSLGPFLGLLGTVWGILTTFADMQSHTSGSTSQIVLGGLSLALATTVLGLVAAIPALIAYNYLKNVTQRFEIEMEGFATEILAAIEIHYRKVDVR